MGKSGPPPRIASVVADSSPEPHHDRSSSSSSSSSSDDDNDGIAPSHIVSVGSSLQLPPHPIGGDDGTLSSATCAEVASRLHQRMQQEQQQSQGDSSRSRVAVLSSNVGQLIRSGLRLRPHVAAAAAAAAPKGGSSLPNQKAAMKNGNRQYHPSLVAGGGSATTGVSPATLRRIKTFAVVLVGLLCIVGYVGLTVAVAGANFDDATTGRGVGFRHHYGYPGMAEHAEEGKFVPAQYFFQEGRRVPALPTSLLLPSVASTGSSSHGPASVAEVDGSVQSPSPLQQQQRKAQTVATTTDGGAKQDANRDNNDIGNSATVPVTTASGTPVVIPASHRTEEEQDDDEEEDPLFAPNEINGILPRPGQHAVDSLIAVTFDVDVPTATLLLHPVRSPTSNAPDGTTKEEKAAVAVEGQEEEIRVLRYAQQLVVEAMASPHMKETIFRAHWHDDPRLDASSFPSTASGSEKNGTPTTRATVEAAIEAARRRLQNASRAKVSQINRTMTTTPGEVRRDDSDPSFHSSYHRFFDHRRSTFRVVPLDRNDKTNEEAVQQPTQSPIVPASLTDRWDPLQLDVVYTYVNHSAPSFHQAVRTLPDESSIHFSMNRFRDWDELRYSMRTLFGRGYCGLLVQTNKENNVADADGGRGRRRCAEVLQRNPDEDVALSSLLRRVFVVVADHDQVPQWLNTSYPLIRVVTHQELVEGGDESGRERARRRPSVSAKLPTFNSNAIESLLHRIPGLSRFFVYFNNDMLWGRRVSLFDYFRPISLFRQLNRKKRFVSMGTNDGESSTSDKLSASPYSFVQKVSPHPDSSFSATTTATSTGGSPSVPSSYRYRVTLLFEPIVYFDLAEVPEDAKLQPIFPSDEALEARRARHEAARQKLEQERNISNLNSTTTTPTPQRIQVLRRASVFRLLSRVATRFRRRLPAEQWRIFNSNVRNYLYRRLNTYYPSHSFAHYPVLMDQRLLEEMVDRDFVDVMQETRGRPIRGLEDAWTPLMYAYYQLAQRTAADVEYAHRTFQHWSVCEEPQEGTHRISVHAYHHHQEASRIHGTFDDRVGSVKWNASLLRTNPDGAVHPLVDSFCFPLRRYEGNPLVSPLLETSAAMMDHAAVAGSAPSSTSSSSSSSSLFVGHLRAYGKMPVSMQVGYDLNITWDLVQAATNRTELDEGRLILSHSPVSLDAVRGASEGLLSPYECWKLAEQRHLQLLELLQKASHPDQEETERRQNGAMALGRAFRGGSSKKVSFRQLVECHTPSVVEMKLDSFVTLFHGSRHLYRFTMINGRFALEKLIVSAYEDRSLFVTVNDDLPDSMASWPETAERMRTLLETVSALGPFGLAGPAPWEKSE